MQEKEGGGSITKIWCRKKWEENVVGGECSGGGSKRRTWWRRMFKKNVVEEEVG